MNRFATPFAAASILLMLLACTGASPGTPDVTQEQVVGWIEQGNGPLLLDVRTPDEYAAGHVPGAINIPHDQLATRLGELGAAKDREIVVYCESGRRAGWALETLTGAGFGTLRHLDGDMKGWRSAGLPTE